jgi:hypothetical protein
MSEANEGQLHRIVRLRVPRPRELPRRGSGALHDEQQYCYDKGYAEGVAALRQVQRQFIEANSTLCLNNNSAAADATIKKGGMGYERDGQG